MTKDFLQVLISKMNCDDTGGWSSLPSVKKTVNRVNKSLHESFQKQNIIIGLNKSD